MAIREVETEELMRLEIERLAKDRQVVEDCKHLLTIINRLACLEPQELIKAEECLEGLWKEKPLLIIDTMMNILALDKNGEIDVHQTKVLCTVLSVYIGKVSLNWQSHEDTNILLHWINKMAYLVFIETQSEEKLHLICLPYIKLFSFFDFFDNSEFADEVYFRFVKKHFEDCLTENNLSKIIDNQAKLFTFLSVLIQEDHRIMTYSFPKVINDAISALCRCSAHLCSHAFDEDKERTLEYVQKINTTLMELLIALTTYFSKYCTQALDVFTNKDLSSHLLIMQQFVNSPELGSLDIEKSLLLRFPLVKMVSSLVMVARHFEIDVKKEAQKHQDKVQEMIILHDFSVSFQAISVWIKQTMNEMLRLGPKINQTDPVAAQSYYHESIELIALSVELPALSLDLQREVDE